MTIFELTIKQKIALGFASIGLLLLAGSSFFYHSLSKIQTANINIETLAVPVQNQSNALQITLLKMAKTGSLAYSQIDNDNIDLSYKQFKQLQLEFREVLKTLSAKVADQPTMLQSLTQAQKSYQQYEQQSHIMFSAKLEIGQNRGSFSTLKQQFDNVRINASNNMIDLELIEAPSGEQQLLNEVIGGGVRIDDMLFTLGNTMTELGRLTSVDTVNIHKQDVAMLLGNITVNGNYLTQQAEPLGATALFVDFGTNLQAIKQFTDTPGTLYLAQANVVNQQRLAENSNQQANTFFDATNTQLDQLVKLANERFHQLQMVAIDEVSTAQTFAITMAVVFVLMAMFIYYFTSKAMLGPLQAINSALSRIASGDLSRRLTKRNNDEFGELMDNINKLSDDLTNLLQAISRDAHLLDESALRSQAQSETISHSAAGQINNINQAKQLAEQIHHSSNQVNEQASESEQHVKLASSQGVQIKTIANDNRFRIEALSTSLRDSVETMAKLSQHSDNIGGILTTISAIADQTNLLALNAAIEAARAGEHGRGFAVVADEVRSLASRTQLATAEIQTMISALQQETTYAVTAISQGQIQASECVEQSQSLHDAIEQIEAALSTINGMSQSITHAANEQVSHSQQIEQTMTQTADSAEQNAHESASMTQQSQQLNQLAHSLTTSVERFKL
ncbi:methyl-accepting chemotaxis protein [Shewanella sp. ALD9]|jgi:methyl-accepting chemotaxis protein|uniref:methyl-accepting chemotaxis protein n=1 Tax=Shewanella sp. ALD9 TaxID=2058330 RepID=UPI001F5B175B|nr:methyl-accepting chemotaxis protein [Shewanella sp. ALD9]